MRTLQRASIGGFALALTAAALIAATDRAATQPLNKLPPARAPCSGSTEAKSAPEASTKPETAKQKPDSAQNGTSEEQVTVASEENPLDSIRAVYAALRACWVPPPKNSARHGMEYTIRFAFKRDGGVVAPPRMTYASHDAPIDVREVYRDAVDAALARCTPLHFSAGMADMVAGRPIAIRFVDNRSTEKSPR